MALEGVLAKAALDALPKEVELKGEVTITKDKQDGKKHSHRADADKTITHHYKVTQTQSYEVDDSVNEKDNLADDVEQTKTSKKSRGCFSMCFGKRD